MDRHELFEHAPYRYGRCEHRVHSSLAGMDHHISQRTRGWRSAGRPRSAPASRIRRGLYSGQGQYRDPVLAMDREVTVSLTAVAGLRVETAPTLRKPSTECVDIHG